MSISKVLQPGRPSNLSSALFCWSVPPFANSQPSNLLQALPLCQVRCCTRHRDLRMPTVLSSSGGQVLVYPVSYICRKIWMSHKVWQKWSQNSPDLRSSLKLILFLLERMLWWFVTEGKHVEGRALAMFLITISSVLHTVTGTCWWVGGWGLVDRWVGRWTG